MGVENAWRTALIGEALPGYGDKLPAIAGGVERQLQHTIGVIATDFAVGNGRAKRVERPAARADHKLANPTCCIRHTVGVLGGKAFIIMVVTAENEVGAIVIERLPDGRHTGFIAMFTGAKAGMMPVGQCTSLGIGGQVGA